MPPRVTSQLQKGGIVMTNRLFLFSLLVATVGVALAGCDITRYTTATTSPGSSAFTADGLLKDEQKALFFIGVNEEKSAARHFTSSRRVSHLAEPPAAYSKRGAGFLLAQSRYPSLYASKDETPEDMLAALTALWNQHESVKTYIPHTACRNGSFGRRR